MCLSDLDPSVAASQVLREAQARIQQAPPPPGSSSPQKDSGLGTTGDATRKEFEVRSLLAAAGAVGYAMAMSAPATLQFFDDDHSFFAVSVSGRRLCQSHAHIKPILHLRAAIISVL